SYHDNRFLDPSVQLPKIVGQDSSAKYPADKDLLTCEKRYFLCEEVPQLQLPISKRRRKRKVQFKVQIETLDVGKGFQRKPCSGQD
ncbi:hypothetical protein RvY_19369, partial [Ramazzottius varieornatus]